MLRLGPTSKDAERVDLRWGWGGALNLYPGLGTSTFKVWQKVLSLSHLRALMASPINSFSCWFLKEKLIYSAFWLSLLFIPTTVSIHSPSIPDFSRGTCSKTSVGA